MPLSARRFKIGDRVQLTKKPFKGHTGTVINKGRYMLRLTWFVQLDQAAAFGRELAYMRDQDLRLLPAHEDPRNL